LYQNSTGTGNTAVGFGALGIQGNGNDSNQAVIGNPGMTSIGGYVAWSNLSDGRFKKNIKENVPGLEFIKQLRPITYTLDVTSLNKFIRPTPSKDRSGKTITPSANETAAIQQKEQALKKSLTPCNHR